MTVDIAIIGAGAAGLAAADRLRRTNLSFQVLEARDRLGGRGWTTSAGGVHPLDLGCGWLHSADENPFVGVAADLGVDLDRSMPPWQKPAWRGNFSLAEQDDYRASWAAFYERLEAADKSTDRPASDFLTPGDPWNPLIDAGSTFINGVELSGLSTIDYDRYHDTEINWRTPVGFGALIARMGDAIPITLRCPVSMIDHSGPRVLIHTPAGVIEARAVIVTVSTNLLATEAIRFSPALPQKVEAAAKLPLGLADKLFLSVADADDLPVDGRLYGSRDQVGIASYHLRPFGRPLIECYFGGAFARTLEHVGDAAFADFAIGEIASAMGTRMRARLAPIAVSRWALDPFAMGSYSHARVGCADARETLAAPVDDRLFFAGEACSRRDFSTAHGAFRTGVAAAEACLAALR